MKAKKHKILTHLLGPLLLSSMATAVVASPSGFPLFSIDPGSAPDASGQCTTGSCFGMQLAPDFWLWTMINPGNDGGFITDKYQLSGGQELASSATNTTPGDITAAWFFFGNFGTFFADNTLNFFSGTSNDGMTVLNDFNVAWNGEVIAMGGGSVNDYSLVPTGDLNITYSLDYSAVVPTGPFQGVNFRLLARGTATNQCVCAPPFASDISIAGRCGSPIEWVPEFNIESCSCYPVTLPEEPPVCSIEANALNGNATVNADCSSGSYISGDGFEGTDSFTYSVSGNGITATGAVMVAVNCDPLAGCDSVPIVQVTTIGGGQGATVNETLQTTFTGAITTEAGLTSGGKNAVNICPSSTVGFETTSSVGVASCTINNAVTASMGRLAVGDKLICTNKPEGNDVDRFSIKGGH